MARKYQKRKESPSKPEELCGARVKGSRRACQGLMARAGSLEILAARTFFLAVRGCFRTRALFLYCLYLLAPMSDFMRWKAKR